MGNKSPPHSRSGRAMPLESCRPMPAYYQFRIGCPDASPALLLFINPNQMRSWLTTRDSGAGYAPAIAAFRLLRSNRVTAS